MSNNGRFKVQIKCIPVDGNKNSKFLINNIGVSRNQLNNTKHDIIQH